MKTLVIKYIGNAHYEVKVVEGLVNVAQEAFYIPLKGNRLNLRVKRLNKAMVERIQALGIEVVVTLI